MIAVLCNFPELGMPPPPTKPTRKRNRKRKRRAASSSSSSSEVSDDSSSEAEAGEQTLKPAQKPAKVAEESSASSSLSEDDSTSSSESESDSEASNSPVKQQQPLSPQPPPELHSKTRHIRASLSPSPPPATLPSFISPGDDGDGQRNKEMQEKFRNFWMASVTDGFREDLEVIQKEPNMNTTKLAMLIDSLASGADVFTSSGSKSGVNEIGVALE
ncbi:hypothetical protein JOM56_012036 [Amanita muscaria]